MENNQVVTIEDKNLTKAVSNMIIMNGKNYPGLDIETGHDYFKKLYNLSDYELENYIENNYNEYEIIAEIIALDYGIYSFRRIGHMCGSNNDALKRLRHQKIKEYEEKFNKEFIDYNKDIDW